MCIFKNYVPPLSAQELFVVSIRNCKGEHGTKMTMCRENNA